ncbi:hypothetical protein GCWU000323_01344 [Leptotrichia hofstadii F0254]|uniref:Uncharacterized protein n=1 Tax=Leptotrichia hofstadii F0254 TaxID=634994 RepID=C9MXD6_9FUSO|nr:hypothetical protein GCWU000323_01344 [Leptotrichia hofstadii F0254]
MIQTQEQLIWELSLKLKEKFRQLQMEMPKMIQERLLNGH